MSVKSSPIYTAPVPKMPPGLIELMEGLAKEVLRCNPPDVHSFCADHVKKLIEIRDGPTPKRELTLEQKIAIATKKIKARAERHRGGYVIISQTNNQSGSHNREENDNAGQYVKNKIVKIPEEELVGDVEHEVIVKIKEMAVSDSLHEPIDTETTLKDTQRVDNDWPQAKSTNADETNDANDLVKDNSIEKTVDSEIVEVIEDNLTIKNEKENVATDIEIPLTEIKSGQNNSVLNISPDSNKNIEEHPQINLNENAIIEDSEKKVTEVATIESETSIDTVVKNEDNEDNLDTTMSPHVAQDKSESQTNVPISKEDLIDREETVRVSIVVDEHKNENDPQVDTAVNDPILTEKENDINITNQVEQIDLLIIPSDLPDEGDVTNSELPSHMNNTAMDLETAAVTIQKVFRSFLFKNKTLSTDDATNVDMNSLIEDKDEKGDNVLNMNVSKDRRTLGLSRIDTVLQTVNEEKSLSQSTDDSSTLSSAATIIQAHVRGFLIRNKYNTNKNSSTTSGVDSDGLSFTSMEGDNDNRKSKTILNIHIVPENGHFMSRDESMLTSIDLSLDGSPPCSTNLHPLSQDTCERRKQLKREDAFQSISPPSNNSGKLSEDVDSVKEILINGNNKDENLLVDPSNKGAAPIHDLNDFNISTMVDNIDSALEVKSLGPISSPVKYNMADRPHSLPEMHSDEMDVITPYAPSEEMFSNGSSLMHSGEFHEVVLPTKVARGDTSVVREFQNVLVYFLLWNNA